MNLGESTAFNQKLVVMAEEIGTKGVNAFVEAMGTAYTKMDETSQKMFASLASTIDIDEIKNLDDFKTILEDFGISVSQFKPNELEEIGDKLQALAAKQKRTIIDLSKAESQLTSLKSAKDIVKETINKDETTYSEDDFNTLKSAGISTEDFFYDGDTYTYLGD